MTTEQEAAVAKYRNERSRFLDLTAREDAAFGRYFAKLQNGERTSGAATSRLANLVNYASGDLSNAAIKLFLLDLDPYKIDADDGVDTGLTY